MRAADPIHHAIRRNVFRTPGHSSAREGARFGSTRRKATFLRRELIRWRARSSSRRGRSISKSTQPSARKTTGSMAVFGQITFQGSRTRVAVRFGSEADFIVELGGVNELPPEGQAVSLRWPVARSLAFLDASAAPWTKQQKLCAAPPRRN